MVSNLTNAVASHLNFKMRNTKNSFILGKKKGTVCTPLHYLLPKLNILKC